MPFLLAARARSHHCPEAFPHTLDIGCSGQQSNMGIYLLGMLEKRERPSLFARAVAENCQLEVTLDDRFRRPLPALQIILNML